MPRPDPVASPMRMIVWAPGEIGTSALRRALLDPEIDVVGVKVYSDSKHGTDIGTLAGLDPVGVLATTDVGEILALDADVVVHTPKPFAAIQGGDRQVLALLESGKNVVSTLSYFCPALVGSMSEDRPLTEQVEMLSTATGPMPRAARTGQQVARAVIAGTRIPVAGRAVRAAVDGLGVATNRLVPERRALRRPGPRRYSRALAAGGTTLHGTGLNPGYMAEQVTVALAGLVDGVRHIRFIECGDLSEAPEGMWVGLDGIGFGTEPSTVGPTHAFTLGSEIYQPEVVANVGHAVFGLAPDEIDQSVDLRGLPAKERITAGGITIERGRTAVLNQTHLGRARGAAEPFYTNEMCWFVGVPNGYYGDTVPFGPMGPGGYTMIVEADPLTVRCQSVSQSKEPGFAAVTDVSVNMVFDALGAAVDGAPGVLANDMRPHYRHTGDDSGYVSADAWAARPTSHTVAVLGSGPLAETIMHLNRPGITVTDRVDDVAAAVASGADCVAVTSDIAETDLLALLEAGIDVVTDRALSSAITEASDLGASVHSTGNHAGVVASRTIKLMTRGTKGLKKVRYVDALDLDGAERPRIDALGLGGSTKVDVETVLASIDGGSVAAVDAAAAAAFGVEQAKLSYTTDVDHTIADGDVVAVHLTRKGRLGRRIAVVHEIVRYLGEEHADRGSDLPLGNYTEQTCLTLVGNGERASGGTQIEFASASADRPEHLLVAGAMLDAVPAVCASTPGVLVTDPGPHYRRDERMPPA